MRATRYRLIAERIRRQILARRTPHQRLPSEPELARRFRAARETIRRALAELQREGLIYCRQGVGSFVAEPRVDQELDRLVGFSEFVQQQGLRPGARILETGILRIDDPNSRILRELGLGPGSRVIFIRRLRTAGGDPLVIASTWLPEALFPDFLRHDLRRRSVYSIMERGGCKPTRAIEILEAVILDPEQARLLEVPPGSPAFLIRRTGFANGIPVEYAEDYYRGDRTSFRVRLGGAARPAPTRLGWRARVLLLLSAPSEPVRSRDPGSSGLPVRLADDDSRRARPSACSPISSGRPPT
jgi:GntR family transcriptional regulator